MLTSEQLQGLGEAELRALAQGLLAQITERDGLIAERDAEIALRQDGPRSRATSTMSSFGT